jgi:SSS family solute:Na+ symporter
MSTLLIVAIPGLIARHLFPGLEKPDMVYPTMILKLMPIGLLGIMLAALLSALTSSLSAILNSTSTLFTIDFYSKWNKQADSKRLVMVGKIASCIIILLSALWAPHIGKFGSLLKYYQEMLSFISPPIVATFIMGIFNKRVNSNGAFAGLISGLIIAIVMLIFKGTIHLHFLLVVPFLFGLSCIIIYLFSLFYARPSEDKLCDTTFSMGDFKNECRRVNSIKWYKNYLYWSLLLLLLCAVIWIAF